MELVVSKKGSKEALKFLSPTLYFFLFRFTFLTIAYG